MLGINRNKKENCNIVSNIIAKSKEVSRKFREIKYIRLYMEQNKVADAMTKLALNHERGLWGFDQQFINKMRYIGILKTYIPLILQSKKCSYNNHVSFQPTLSNIQTMLKHKMLNTRCFTRPTFCLFVDQFHILLSTNFAPIYTHTHTHTRYTISASQNLFKKNKEIKNTFTFTFRN